MRGPPPPGPLEEQEQEHSGPRCFLRGPTWAMGAYSSSKQVSICICHLFEPLEELEVVLKLALDEPVHGHDLVHVHLLEGGLQQLEVVDVLVLQLRTEFHLQQKIKLMRKMPKKMGSSLIFHFFLLGLQSLFSAVRTEYIVVPRSHKAIPTNIFLSVFRIRIRIQEGQNDQKKR